VGRVAAVVLDPQLAHAERLREPRGAAQVGHAGADVDAGGEVLAGGQQAGVAPDGLGARLDGGARDEPEPVLVVRHLERGEALVAHVHGREGGVVTALAAVEADRRGVGEGGGNGGQQGSHG
jgi:hypothetical protein